MLKQLYTLWALGRKDLISQIGLTMRVWPFCFLHMFVEFLDKFPSEPPAFTQMRVGGGGGNFTIPLGEPVL